jgi:CelD/BcsL family acetyltransferase involved in cellulose biosynthesis
LPSTEGDYFRKLGKATKKNLTRHRNRLSRDYPTFAWRIFSRDEIEERHIRQIVDFNRARMHGKHKYCGFHEDEVLRLITLAATHGMVLVATIEGRVCAGSICQNVGGNYFMELAAHDPVFDEYRLGTLCCFLTICEAIARGGKELHFLWGRDEYKYMLLGRQRDLDNVLVYRSRVHMLLNGGLVLRSLLQACKRRAKLELRRETGSLPLRHAS